MTLTDKPREISPASLLEFRDQDYRAPSTEDVREALRRGGLTGSQAGALLGTKGRNVRKWTSGYTSMPYSSWRLLLIAIGEVEPEMVKIPSDAP